MFKKVIKYKDYNGNLREEAFYFHLSKAELVDLNWRTPGGLSALYDRIIETKDGQKLADEFKKLIQLSYGVKSLDGRRFIKNQEVLDNFIQTEAYSELYIELATNSETASAFANGIMPEDMVQEALKEAASQPANMTPMPQPVAPAQPMVEVVSQPVMAQPQPETPVAGPVQPYPTV